MISVILRKWKVKQTQLKGKYIFPFMNLILVQNVHERKEHI